MLWNRYLAKVGKICRSWVVRRPTDDEYVEIAMCRPVEQGAHHLVCLLPTSGRWHERSKPHESPATLFVRRRLNSGGE